MRVQYQLTVNGKVIIEGTCSVSTLPHIGEVVITSKGVEMESPTSRWVVSQVYHDLGPKELVPAMIILKPEPEN
ncbi:MAG: hypothetical protein IH851_08515 [Armatimonadetes bacterium]|nr:hypothetical protein [Armatimonadota bacterium]